MKTPTRFNSVSNLSAAIILLGAIALPLRPAFAGSATWQNTSGGSWFTSTDWSGGAEPTSSDNVFIATEGVVRVQGGTAEALEIDVSRVRDDGGYQPAQLNIQGGGTVSVGGGEGTLFLGTPANSDGVLTIGGALHPMTGFEAATSAGILDAANVVTTSGGSIAFNHTDSSYTFGANITGGQITHFGPGKTTLSGDVQVGSFWIADGTLEVTKTTSGFDSLNIDDGGAFSVNSGGDVFLTPSPYSLYASVNGLLEVTGAGSTFSAALWSIEVSLTGTFSISDGGVFTGTGGPISNMGILEVTGTGSVLSNSGALFFSGTQTVSDGGTLSSAASLFMTDGSFTVSSAGDATVARLFVEGGLVEVTGAGSQLSITDDEAFDVAEIGGTSGASLLVSDGGKVNSATPFLFVGTADGTQGDVTVTGAGSELNVGGIYAGATGGASTAMGSIEVTDGGKVTGNQLSLSHGTVVIDGAGSELAVGTGLLYVSTLGSETASLSVTNGGKLVSGSAFIGGNSGSTGQNEVLISGAGSQWSAVAQIVLGWDTGSSGETNSLTIADGAVVDITQLGYSNHVIFASGTSTLNIGTGGAPGTLNTLDVIGNNEANGTIVFNHNQDGYVFSPNISGKVNINFAGTGSTILTGENTHTGDTLVTSGTLYIDGDQSGSTGDISVSAGATLAGSGVIGGNVEVAGTLSPGDSSGSLTIDGNLSLLSGAKFQFSLTSMLIVTGTVSLDATFGIDDLIGLTSATANGTYTLIDSTSTNFDLVVMENYGAAKAYDLGDGKFAYFKQGSLQVEVVPEPTSALLMLMGSALFLRRRATR